MSRGQPFLAVIIAMLGFPAAADNPRPTDYADGFPIAITRPGPIITVPLTADVYFASARGNLRDVAVFNGRGELVPHALRAAKSTTTDQGRRTVALPMFPRDDEDAGSASSMVTIAAGGALVLINGGVAPAPASAATSYVLDASHIDAHISALTIELAADAGDMLSTVAIDGSDDLTHWSTLVPDRRLASLRHNGHTLTQLRIPLPANRRRYLLLRFLDQTGTQPIRRVVADVRSARPASPPGERRLLPPSVLQDTAGALQFDLGAQLPVREIGLVMAPNQLFEATLQSRAAPSDHWRTHTTAVFYALERDGLLLRPSAVRAAVTPHRYWQLAGTASPIPAGVQLEVTWQPATLVFVATGEPPYTLAVGRAEAASEATIRTAALGRFEGVKASGRGTLGAATELGGAAQRVVSSVVPWRRVGLWAVLLVGVAATGLMVLRLLRQMRDGS